MIDLRYSLRVLLKSPGFSIAAVLVLAAAIGVNTAVFSFVNAFVLRPLPGREKPGEVVGIFCRDRTRPDSYRDFSYPNYADIRQRANVFLDATAFSLTFAGIREGDATRRTLVSPVTSSYFSTLGVGLHAGRAFTQEEERPAAHAAVAIVSYDYWKRREEALVPGARLEINGRSFTIVGIAPRGFTGTTAAIAPEVWVPTGAWDEVTNGASASGAQVAGLGERRNHLLMMVARLKPGVSQQAAASALSSVAAALAREFPGENRDQELLVASLPRLTMASRPQSDAGSIRYSALVMLIASIVLLVAGMNLANMVLARGTARQKEVAMRLALGGSRARIVRQLLTEGFVLSVLGGAAGLVVAYWSSRILWSSLIALSPIALSFDPVPDVRVLGATLAFCAATTVFFGLGPAWKLSRTDIVSQLKSLGGAAAGVSRARRWSARDALVAGQFALSLALLVTAGLFVRGAWKASTSEPGYHFEGRGVATLDAGLAGYDQSRGRAAYRRAVERVRALPEVSSASMSSSIAFSTIVESRTVRVAGAAADAAAVDSVLAVVGSGYFRTLGLPMLRGRDFSPSEEQEAAASPVAIVDQPLARRLFGNEDPVGRRISVEDQAEPLLVVGLAPGLRQSLWDKAPVPHVYLSSGEAYRGTTHLHVSFRPGTAVPEGLQAVRREIRAADETLPVMALQSLEEHRATTTTYWAVGAMAWIFSVFGALALSLAVVGIYAVKAYLVARRTREIGIRMALGSTPGQVLALVLREGIGLTAAGLLGGLLIGLAIGRAVSALLYDVSPFDPLVFIATPAVLALAVLAACWLPARRAARIAPVVALRME